jgi:hypothetical protein
MVAQGDPSTDSLAVQRRRIVSKSIGEKPTS